MTNPEQQPVMPVEDDVADDDPGWDDDPDWGSLLGATWDGAEVDDGEQDLADRLSLTRVPGLSTDLDDITEVEYRQLRLERVVLVSVWHEGTQDDSYNAVRELAALAQTAGSQVLDALIQRRDHVDPATYIGRGKVDEVRDVVMATKADTVICDGELSPAQLRNLEDRVGVKVVDRTALILDIFAQHAKSVEGKTQVELAQLQYLRQRLRGWGDSLSRQVGGRAASGVGIGGRGPGETKIETDRRRINARVALLRAKLRTLDETRALQRADRRRSLVPSVAIVGYTNAGKSSLLNRLTGAGVMVEDALFATLDPTTRRSRTADGRIYTLTDTVGFVRHLPHDLVEAFKSTLEETALADLLLHVVDGSDADPMAQIRAVRQVLQEIGAGDAPEQIVVNKIDAADPAMLEDLRQSLPGAVFVSAHTGAGLDRLRHVVETRLPTPGVSVRVLVPYERGDLVDRIHRRGELSSSEHTPEGTLICARVNADLAGELAPFEVA